VVIEKNEKKGLADHNGQVLIPATYDDLGWSKGSPLLAGDIIGYKVDDSWGLINIHNKKITGPIFSQVFKAGEQNLIAAKRGQFSQKDFYGIIDLEGKNVTGFQFTELTLSGGQIIGIYRKGNEYLSGLLSNSGRTIIPFEYLKVNRISLNLLQVKNHLNHYAIFSNEGTDLTGFVLDNVERIETYLKLYSEGKVGLMDDEGKMIFKPEFAQIHIEKDMTSALSLPRWDILDLDGKLVKKFYFDDLTPFTNSTWKISSENYEGLISADGNVLTNNSITFISDCRDDVALFKSDGKFGVIRSNGKIILKPQYDSLFYEKGFIYAENTNEYDQTWNIIDTFGIRKNQVSYEAIRRFKEGMFAVKKRGKWGFIDRTGKEIVSCVYDDIKAPEKGLIEVKFHGEYGVISYNNTWVVLPKKYPVEITSDSTYILKNPYQNSLYSFNGDLIYFTDYTLENSNGYLREKKGDSTLWLIDLQGRVLDTTSPMLTVKVDDSDVTIVRKNGKWGAFSSNGKVIINFDNDYEEIFPPSEGYFGIKENGAFGFVDFQNKLRIANRYEGIKPFASGLAAVMIRGRWGFIDKREILVIQPLYDETESFDHPLVIVSQSGKKGLMDKAGKLVVPLDYTQIIRQSDGKFLVDKYGQKGMLASDGQMILSPKFQEITDTGYEYLITKRGDKYGIVAVNGVPLIPPVYDNIIFDNDKNTYLAKTNGTWVVKKR